MAALGQPDTPFREAKTAPSLFLSGNIFAAYHCLLGIDLVDWVDYCQKKQVGEWVATLQTARPPRAGWSLTFSCPFQNVVVKSDRN